MEDAIVPPDHPLARTYRVACEEGGIRPFMKFGSLPSRVEQDPGELRDRFRGSLIGLAIGDALGLPVEGRDPGSYFVAGYQRSHRSAVVGPGTISDDTQMTCWLAESLLDKGGVDPGDIVRRFSQERIRGIGRATRSFVRGVAQRRSDWCSSGVDSAGNGAAMRATPIALFYAKDPLGMKLAAGLQAMVTHRSSMALASSIVLTGAVARLLSGSSDQFSSLEARQIFSRDLASLIEDLEADREYRTRNTDQPSSLHCRLMQDVPELLELGATPLEANEAMYSGAYVLESLPMAFFCFLRSPGSPDQVVLDAVNASRDSDTVGAMAGALAGALHGYSCWPAELTNVEFHDRLLSLADRLFDRMDRGNGHFLLPGH